MRPYPCEAESAGPGGPRQRARAVVTASLQPADLFGTKREPPAKHFGARYGRVGPRASLPQSGGRIIVRGRPCPAFFVQLPGRSRGAESVAQYVRSSARLPSWNERMRPPDRKKAGGWRAVRRSRAPPLARPVPRAQRAPRVPLGPSLERNGRRACAGRAGVAIWIRLWCLALWQGIHTAVGRCVPVTAAWAAMSSSTFAPSTGRPTSGRMQTSATSRAAADTGPAGGSASSTSSTTRPKP